MICCSNFFVSRQYAGCCHLLFGLDFQAARALANLAAHGDSNGNNAAVGQEAGALEALVQLTCSRHEGVRYCIHTWNLLPHTRGK